jgi:hypothetical protein
MTPVQFTTAIGFGYPYPAHRFRSVRLAFQLLPQALHKARFAFFRLDGLKAPPVYAGRAFV